MNQKGRNSLTVDKAFSLKGKTILITRPKDQAGEFARLLAEQGAGVRFLPSIEIAPPASWHQFDRAIGSLHEYDGIIFTSANAVRAFLQAYAERGMTSNKHKLGEKVFYVVGEKTGETLKAAGFSPTLLPDVTNGRELAEALRKTSPRDKRFLFPRGNLGGVALTQSLQERGSRVDEVMVYETVAPRDDDATAMRQQFENDTIDVVTFFSPSSVKNLLAIVPVERVSSKTIAVIGSSTEAAAKALGLAVHIVAAQPSAAAFVDAIVRYFTK